MDSFPIEGNSGRRERCLSSESLLLVQFFIALNEETIAL
jgi:hypothetical protein